LFFIYFPDFRPGASSGDQNSKEVPGGLVAQVVQNGGNDEGQEHRR